MPLPTADEGPPSYDFDACVPSPSYSASAGSAEHVLLLEHSSSDCPGCDYITETKHMKINMGSRMWGLETPSYGLGGKIEGTVRFSGAQDRVERVTATLIGTLTTSITYNGTPGDPLITILSNTAELYSSSKSDTWAWDQEHPFSIQIPTVVDIRDQSTPTPPSFFAFYQNFACEVLYTLKFHMIRKGLHKHEIKSIPIFYLPKSSPTDPPLTSIPRFPRGQENAASCFGIFKRVKSVAITPIHPRFMTHKTKFNLGQYKNCITLSLPSPRCFTSGEPIPFVLSFVFPKDPMLASLLGPTAQIHLSRQVTVSRNGGKANVQRDTCLSSAELRTLKEFREGVILLRGDIQAGTPGGEASWRLENVIEVQYVLRVLVRPPGALADHLPSFQHEEIVEITTDYWGTLERELASVGGTPMPALGLAKSLRRDI